MEEDDPRFTLVWSRYLALLVVGLQVGGLAYSAVASIRPWRFLTFDLTATRWAIQVRQEVPTRFHPQRKSQLAGFARKAGRSARDNAAELKASTPRVPKWRAAFPST